MIVLIGLSFLVEDPTVFTIRRTLVAALVSIGVVAGVGAVLTRRLKTAALIAAGIALTTWNGLRPALDRSVVLPRVGADAKAVERHFVVGYDTPASAQELVLRAHVGGLFLTRRNVAGREAADIGTDIAKLQTMRREAGLPSLIVAADQEGGPVAHLSPPLPPPPALSSLAALPAKRRQDAARQNGFEQGTALKRLGVTMDLAPVSDLTPSRPSDTFDLHTRIATRSISGDPAVAAMVAAAFSEGLLAAGVTPTAKHFPGLGRVATDTHLFAASLATSVHDLDTSDWIPFRAVLGIAGSAVMLSHVSLDAVEDGVPASRSKRVVAGILRSDWGFDGIAITDDLTMGAVEHAGLCMAVEGALNAGIDLLLVSWDTDKAYPALRCALDALDAGRLDQKALAASALRLDKLTAIGAVPGR